MDCIIWRRIESVWRRMFGNTDNILQRVWSWKGFQCLSLSITFLYGFARHRDYRIKVATPAILCLATTFLPQSHQQNTVLISLESLFPFFYIRWHPRLRKPQAITSTASYNLLSRVERFLLDSNLLWNLCVAERQSWFSSLPTHLPCANLNWNITPCWARLAFITTKAAM